MKSFLSFLLNRARERSTWLGLVSLATALGIVLTEFQTEAIIAAGMSFAGVIAAFTGDKDDPDDRSDKGGTTDNGGAR